MTRFEQKDLSFDVPPGWQDRTVIAFAAPEKPGKVATATLIVTREKLGPNESLRTYSSRQLAQVARVLDGFELHESRDVNVAGLPAVQHVFGWNAAAGPLVQRITFAAVSDTVVGFTGTMPKSEVAELSPVFDQLLASVRFTGMTPGRTY